MNSTLLDLLLVNIRGLDEPWQADLVDISSYARKNSKHKFHLTVIDTVSKFASAVRLRNKNGNDAGTAVTSTLVKGTYTAELAL